MMPAIFISHGPPTILLMDNDVTRFLKSLGTEIPRPEAILCVSAHWEAVRPMLTAAKHPGIIYDFSGPPPLFDKQYPAMGHPGLAHGAIDLLLAAGIDASPDAARGLDHGTWVPLYLMFPEADIPVVQLSIQTERDPRHHLDMGRALAPLREKGVLLMGSGGAVHNLDEVHRYAIDADAAHYAVTFDRWLEGAVTSAQLHALLDYKKQAPWAERCHPYPAEHFLPFFVPLGASKSGHGRLLHRSFLYGVLSMAAYLWE
jgi:4,5-DOPA dioxygenase extradiol